MRPIQPLLLALLIGGVVLYFRRFQSRLRDRLVILSAAIACAVLTAVPEWSTYLAHSVGVGRGVDLVIYLSLAAMGSSIAMLYAHLRMLELRIATLARELAILSAREPSKRQEHD